MTVVEYICFIYFLIPVFSAITCGFLMILSCRDSQSQGEIHVKRVMSWYFLSASISWFCIFAYLHLSEIFIYINSFCYLTFLLIQVLFYHLFYILTRIDEQDRFSSCHYVLPVVMSCILLIWSFFIPLDVQLAIVKGKGASLPPGYESYARFFLSKPLARLLFGIVYATLTFIRLRKYHKMMHLQVNSRSKLHASITIIIGLTLSSLLCSFIGSCFSRETALHSPVMLFAVTVIICQHLVLTYYVIQRQSLFYTIMQGKGEGNHVHAKNKQYHSRSSKIPEILTQKTFETYIKKYKPYLDPDFKITDLVEELGINRTYISRFINETYKVNFNRYINRCRLLELERLAKLPSNLKIKPYRLASKAGFRDGKHYLRAQKNEQTQQE